MPVGAIPSTCVAVSPVGDFELSTGAGAVSLGGGGLSGGMVSAFLGVTGAKDDEDGASSLSTSTTSAESSKPSLLSGLRGAKGSCTSGEGNVFPCKVAKMQSSF